jgi:hypothetical protein
MSERYKLPPLPFVPHWHKDMVYRMLKRASKKTYELTPEEVEELASDNYHLCDCMLRLFHERIEKDERIERLQRIVDHAMNLSGTMSHFGEAMIAFRKEYDKEMADE